MRVHVSVYDPLHGTNHMCTNHMCICFVPFARVPVEVFPAMFSQSQPRTPRQACIMCAHLKPPICALYRYRGRIDIYNEVTSQYRIAFDDGDKVRVHLHVCRFPLGTQVCGCMHAHTSEKSVYGCAHTHSCIAKHTLALQNIAKRICIEKHNIRATACICAQLRPHTHMQIHTCKP